MVTLQYLDELSFVLNNRRHISNQAKASSVGDLLNADEDDRFPQWITPEESLIYGREQRPPYIIPRITHYRAYRHEPRKLQDDVSNNYTEDSENHFPSIKDSVTDWRQRQHQDWSPISDRGRLDSFSEASESPPLARPGKRFGGSNENLLGATRRPNAQYSGSGDSLDLDLRASGGSVRRKAQSMIGPRVLSPMSRAMQRPTDSYEAVIHEGTVKRTKFAENGKKTRKNWSDCYMVLTHLSIAFYKDYKTYTAARVAKQTGHPPSPTSARAEQVLPLRNTKVWPCNQQHTSRYARSLLLACGANQVLIQEESAQAVCRWIENIARAIARLPSDFMAINTIEHDIVKPSPSAAHKNRTKHNKVGDSSVEDLSDSTETLNVKAKLMKFFSRRPTMEALVKNGIYKDEPVFGRRLEEVCPETPPRVPEFVVRCIKEIESSEEHLTTDGLYRASGNLSQVQKIRLEIDQNNLSVMKSNPDVHVLTGSLKLFFRELKEPLIPCRLFDRILAATSIKPREARTKEFREIVNILPACNRDTLKFLLEHLLRVTEYKDKNRMHTSNLAIVFGPTLMWAPAELAHNIAIDCIQQNHAIEILLTDFHQIFSDDKDRNKKKA